MTAPNENENEMINLNNMSKEEALKYLMKEMNKSDVSKIIKECNKKTVEKKYLPNIEKIDEDIYISIYGSNEMNIYGEKGYRFNKKEDFINYIKLKKKYGVVRRFIRNYL